MSIVVLVETHTNMKGQWARQILDEAGATNLEVLWHTAHHLQLGQSVDEAYDCIKDHVRHVHLHDLENPGYPYKELFGLLKGIKYDRFCSLEEGYREGGEPKVIALYAALYRELVAQA